MTLDADASPADACKLCGHRSIRPSRQFSFPTWTIVECATCRVRYVDPIPDVATLANYYAYEAYGRPAYDRGATPTATRVAMLSRLLRDAADHGMPRGRLLDVGCSTGQLLEAAKHGGWNPEGIEIDPRTVEVARSRTGARVRVGTGLEALGAEERFEAITMSHWLEHSPEPRRQLTMAREHLEPGGAVLLRVPNTDSDAARYLGWGWRWFSPPVHLYYFNEESLRSVAGRVGLETRWTHVRQGDAWPLPVELAWGYARRLRPRARARKPPAEPSSSATESPVVRAITQSAEALSTFNPLPASENSELVMLLRRPQEVGGADSPS